MTTQSNQQPTTTPAAVNVPQPNLDCEIINVQKKVRELQALHESGEISMPHIFFRTSRNGFVELQQSNFHFNLPDKIHELILESLSHYQRQLENLNELKLRNSIGAVANAV
jgi:hypothetical protein